MVLGTARRNSLERRGGAGVPPILTSYSEAASRERQSVSGYRLDLLQ